MCTYLYPCLNPIFSPTHENTKITFSLTEEIPLFGYFFLFSRLMVEINFQYFFSLHVIFPSYLRTRSSASFLKNISYSKLYSHPPSLEIWIHISRKGYVLAPRSFVYSLVVELRVAAHVSFTRSKTVLLLCLSLTPTRSENMELGARY